VLLGRLLSLVLLVVIMPLGLLVFLEMILGLLVLLGIILFIMTFSSTF